MEDLTVYSPYTKVYDYWSSPSITGLMSKLRDYLLVLPCKECPNPILTNNNPRVRLVKYLYYDTQKPLDEEMPSVQDRLSIVFDPYNPDNPPTEKRYRIFMQSLVNQPQVVGRTILRIYLGRIIPKEFSAMVAISFQILSSYATDANTRDLALIRTINIEQAIVEALNGVNIDGVGSFSFSKTNHYDCVSDTINDEQLNVGRMLTMCFESVGNSKQYNPLYGF